MSRTTVTQFEILVDFMERNGDLNKLGDGLHGRLTALAKWAELARVLNLDMTIGSSKPVEKWKKVWSDFKNNTKRKAAKISQGGPACKLVLSDLEQRVLTLMGTSATTGLPNVVEVGFEPSITADDQLHDESSSLPPQSHSFTFQQVDVKVENIEDRNSPFTIQEVEEDASLPTPHHASQVGSPRWRRGASSTSRRSRHQGRTMPPHCMRTADAAANFLPSDERWHNLATQFAAEHVRLRERELEQQAQWQTLFAKFIDVIINFNRK